MKIGIIQQHNTSNTTDNRERLISKIRNLAASGAQLVVLQELHDSLYFCQVEDVNNFDQAVTIPGDVTQTYSSVANECGIVLVTSLFERRATGLYHNTAVVLEKDGSIAGKYRKMHIPEDPGYYEKFYFTPGDMGFQPIDTSVGRLGVLVCWDQWYPEAARLMADEQERQRMAWQTVQRGHAVANGLPVVTVNRVGDEDGVPFWGTSFVAGPQGELLYEAPTNEEVEVVVDVNMQRSEQVRRWWPFLRDRRIENYSDLTRRFIDKQ